MEGDFIKINEWLLPFSWLYGIAVRFRNQLFELGILKSRAFDTPVISVGNITVGGSGKTPHVEYLIRLLHSKMKVAVLSRGYKRKSKGFVLADDNTPMRDIGDEPYQIKHKFKDVTVAVDKSRCEGIEKLTDNNIVKDIDVILLDDAFQHRYVKPGINILLVDYHRLIVYDKLLPAGRLREPKEGKNRADIVVVTKCPRDLRPMDYRVLTKVMDLFPYQDLFFTTLKYGNLKPLFEGEEMKVDELKKDMHVLLLTGIASPKQMIIDLKPHCPDIEQMSFGDHHAFTSSDIRKINERFAQMPSPKIIITTEKDSTRMLDIKDFDERVRKNIFVLPIEVEIMLDQEETFNEKIIGYVRKNSRSSILAKAKDDNKTNNCYNSGNRSGTISFRNN
jgi:tetraacyldisaccharide 4'-kinase